MIVTETLPGELKILQDTELYRFTSDSVLLAKFARAKAKDRVADFCAGSGIVGLYFLALHPSTESLLLVEIQQELVSLAKESVKLNGLENVSVLHSSVQSISSQYNDGFSLVLSNPPYERSGFENRDDKKAICRKEILITFPQLVEAAYRKLKYGGRFAFVHRADRLAELIFTLKERGLEPKRIQFVSGKEGDKPYLVLIEAVKGGKEGVEILPTLVNTEN
ncbi:MAG: tRNA1(Val) (adenine(37)-N6)-methyltransferase [Christensenellaceae bacterium]